MLIYKVLLFTLLFGRLYSEPIKLPPPKENPFPLFETLLKQCSTRVYKKDALKMDEVSLLLFSSYGIVHTKATRTVPSAGAIYPLSIYLLCGKNTVEGIEEGLYLYIPENHTLERIKKGDLRLRLSLCCYGQSWVREAQISIVICADFGKMERFYGKRAERYIYMEAGHIGQNIHLCATSLGLGAVAIGAFMDSALKALLGTEHAPIYIMCVGRR